MRRPDISSRILIIAWREFRFTVFRKVFLLGVLGVPVLIMGVAVIGGILMVGHEPAALEGQVVVVDADGTLVAAVRAEFDAEKIAEDQREELQALVDAATSGTPAPMTGPPTLKRGEVDIEVVQETSGDETTLEGLRERLRAGELVAVAVIPESAVDPDAVADAGYELYVAPDLEGEHTGLVERRIGRALVGVRASRAGLDPAKARALLRPPRASTRRVLETGADAKEGEGIRVLKQMIPVVFMMLLWVGTFTAGQHLMMSTIEEKSTRVMEVLLGAVSALELMTGKIIGQGAVGLLLLLFYGSLGLVALVAFAVMHLLDPLDLVYLAVFFFMAYFMVASVMAAVGSAVSDIREANTLMMPVMLVMMIPLVLWMPISQDPNGVLATVFSFLPAIPFAMILRVVAEESVPVWQIPVTIVWGYICVLGMVWGAAKVFRVGVLMYGKPPSPAELFRWIRRT